MFREFKVHFFIYFSYFSIYQANLHPESTRWLRVSYGSFGGSMGLSYIVCNPWFCMQRWCLLVTTHTLGATRYHGNGCLLLLHTLFKLISIIVAMICGVATLLWWVSKETCVNQSCENQSFEDELSRNGCHDSMLAPRHIFKPWYRKVKLIMIRGLWVSAH